MTSPSYPTPPRTDTDRLTQLAERPYGFLGMTLGGRKILGIDDLRAALDFAHQAEREEAGEQTREPKHSQESGRGY